MPHFVQCQEFFFKKQSGISVTIAISYLDKDCYKPKGIDFKITNEQRVVQQRYYYILTPNQMVTIAENLNLIGPDAKLHLHFQKIINYLKLPNLNIQPDNIDLIPRYTFQPQRQYQAYHQIARQLITHIFSYVDHQKTNLGQSIIRNLIHLKETGTYNQRVTDYFISMFSISNTSKVKYRYNKKVYNQKRFKDGAINENQLVYNPTTVTQDILNQVTQYIQRPKNSVLLIHGPGGIGKSFSLSLIIELFNMTKDMNVNKTPVPKMFYYSFSSQVEDDVKLDFQKTIACQLPYQVQVQLQERGGTSFWEVLQLHGRQKPKFIFVLDQINVYYAFIRKYYQEKSQDNRSQLRKKIDQASAILSKITLQYSLIVTSSENVQINSLKQLTNKQFMKVFDLQNQSNIDVSVRFHRNNDQTLETTLRQTINIIYFQLQRAIQNKRFPQEGINFDLVRKHKQVLWQNPNYFLSIIDNCRWASQINHNYIKNFLDNHQNRTIINGILTQSGELGVADFLLILCSQIHKYMKRSLTLAYKQYVCKGDEKQSLKRFKQILQVQKTAQGILKRQKNVQSIAQFKHKSYNTTALSDCVDVNRQYSSIKEYQITIYLSPKTFLEITMFQTEYFEILGQQLKAFMQLHKGNRSWLGTSIDTYLVHKATHYITQIDIGDQVHSTAIAKPVQKFIHYTNIGVKKDLTSVTIDSSTTVFVRFTELFNFLDYISNDNDNRWIFAAPQKLSSNQFKTDPSNSTNSQAIDLLLIKKMRNYCYKLITFDFCTTGSISKFLQKVEKADHFFKIFQQVVKLEQITDNWKYIQKVQRQKNSKQFSPTLSRKCHEYSFQSRTHYIVVPHPLYMNYKKRYDQQHRKGIQVMSLKDFKDSTVQKTEKQHHAIESILFEELQNITKDIVLEP